MDTVSAEVMDMSQVKIRGLYLVDKIITKWVDKKTGKPQYRVRWLGYSKSQDTWEPLSSFESCMDLIDDFEKAREKILARKTKKTSSSASSSSSKFLLKKAKLSLTKNKKSQPPKVKGRPKKSPQFCARAQMDSIPESYDLLKNLPIADLCFAETRRDLVPYFGGTVKIRGHLHYFVTWPSHQSFYLMTSSVAEKVFPKSLKSYWESDKPNRPILWGQHRVNTSPPDFLEH